MHRGFPYGIVKEVYRELIETGEKYTRWFVVGLVPPTDSEPLRVVFGCLEEDKNAGPGGTKPRRFFNPVKIPVSREGLTKMMRVLSVLAGCYIAMTAELGGLSLEEATTLAEYDVHTDGLSIAKDVSEKMRHMAGR